MKKQITDVEVDPSQGVTLKFRDGSTATADILLGADGLHSASVDTSFLSELADSSTGGETVIRPGFRVKMEWMDCL